MSAKNQIKNQRRSNKNVSNMMYRLLSQRNVQYIQGMPKQIYNTERVYTMWMTTTTIFTAIASGTLAIAQSLDPINRIANWSTMWAKLFQQYCVLEVEAVVKPKFLNTASSGQVNVLLSEDSSTPNSLSLNREHAILDLVPSSSSDDKKGCCTCKWNPTSAEDWTWTAVTVSQNIIYLKLYGDVGNTGLNSGDSTTQLMANLTYKVAFRYYF
jgi:hypothetical protein